MEEMIGIVVRIFVAYVYALAIMRLSGKSSIGMIAPWDFLIALIIGDMFDDLLWGEIPVSKALAGITAIMALHLLVSYAAYKSRAIDRIVGFRPVHLVRQGRVDNEGLSKERLTQDELRSQLRLRGIDRLEEVREAIMEPDGQTSVLEFDEFKPADKRDLPRLREMA